MGEGEGGVGPTPTGDSARYAFREGAHVLEAFVRALRRESHSLARRPDLLWQQLYNRLQWAPTLQSLPAASQSIGREFTHRCSGGTQAWMHQTKKTIESEYLIREFVGHTDAVSCCQPQPGDAHRLVSGGFDGCLRIWSIRRGAETTFEGSSSRILCCAWSPDGRSIASGAANGRVVLWDALSGTEIASLQASSAPVYCCSFLSHGTRLLSAGADRVLRIWNVTARREESTFRGHEGEILCCAFSPDGHRFASGDANGTLMLWTVGGAPAVPLASGFGPIYSCAFSPDGTVIAAGGAGGSAWLRKVESGDLVATLDERACDDDGCEILSCSFHPDGSTLATGGSDGVIRIWGVESQDELDVYRGHTLAVNACAFTPDGRYLISASEDRSLKLWEIDLDLATSLRPKHLARQNHQGGVLDCAFSSEADLLASTGLDQTIRLWNPQTAELLFTLEGRLECSLDFSPKGTRLISGSADGWLALWDLERREEIATWRAHLGSVYCCRFHPNGNRVVSGGEDCTLRLWDVADQRELAKFEGHGESVNCCSLSPDGNTMVSGSMDGTLRLWNIDSREHIATFRGHEGYVLGCAFGPDGVCIASASFDGTVRIWRAGGDDRPLTIGRHTGEARSCSFCADGGSVVSVGWDRMIRIWSVADSHELAAFPTAGDLLCCDFTARGNLLAAGDEGGNLYLLRLVRPA